MPSLTFDHIHYRSSDFDKTRKFYVDILGATDKGTIDLGPEGHREPNLHFELGGITLLFGPSDESPDSAVPAGKRLGAWHIAFLVDDCDEAARYYADQGAVVVVPTFQADSNEKTTFLSAPDGMFVELKEFAA